LTTLVIHPAEGPLVGSVPVPSDKSIGHRALLISALCEGESRIHGFSHGEDNVSTANALRAMGIVIDEPGPTELIVHGGGLHGLRAPAAALDCGNSGTTMRLLTGVLAAQRFQSTLIGDASLTKRPMLRIAHPLRMRGATVEGDAHPKKAGDIVPPLVVGPLSEGTYLTALEFESPVASAQVKSAILLSGLYAHGTTYFREPSVSRDHTERMLCALGVPLETAASIVRLDPAGWSGDMPALDIDVPGDLSAAAFLVVAAQIVRGSRITIRGVGVNPTRTGILEIARDMGASCVVDSGGERAGEPVATLHAAFAELRSARVGGETIARAIDEVPIACAMAARARGTTTIADAQELRVKESDRIATMVHVLRAFGVTCEERPDGLVIEGSDRPLTAADVESRGDHRIAMTAAVLGLVAAGPSRIRDAGCIATSFPKFVGTLRALGARVEVEG
jgi:3-phosphoshikimate 1-carboxyvinyltransferase